jgi:hypothetical protein
MGPSVDRKQHSTNEMKKIIKTISKIFKKILKLIFIFKEKKSKKNYNYNYNSFVIGLINIK